MRSIVLFAAVASLVTVAYAQKEQDHASHHPDSASAPAAVVKKTPPSARGPSSKAKPGTAATPGLGMGMGMGTDMSSDHMKEMHEEMHKSGGTHDRMHGKDGDMNAGRMSAMPPAPAASK